MIDFQTTFQGQSKTSLYVGTNRNEHCMFMWVQRTCTSSSWTPGRNLAASEATYTRTRCRTKCFVFNNRRRAPTSMLSWREDGIDTDLKTKIGSGQVHAYLVQNSRPDLLSAAHANSWPKRNWPHSAKLTSSAILGLTTIFTVMEFSDICLKN